MMTPVFASLQSQMQAPALAIIAGITSRARLAFAGGATFSAILDDTDPGGRTLPIPTWGDAARLQTAANEAARALARIAAKRPGINDSSRDN